jgi:hypothetical protein
MNLLNIDWNNPNLLIGDRDLLLGKEFVNLSYEEYVLLLARLPEIVGQGVIAPLEIPKVSGIPRLDCLGDIEVLYLCLSLWIQCLTLGKSEIYTALVASEEALLAYPYADFSLATMDYCRQAWMKIPVIQENLPQWETLWFGLELSACRKHLEISGIIGDPKESDRDLMVKLSQIRGSNKFIKKCRQILKKKDLAEAYGFFAYRVGQFEEGQICIPYLGMGIITAIQESDKFLESHCLSFLSALSRFNLALTDPQYQIRAALPGGKEYISGDKKKPPGFGNKNANGRPFGNFKRVKPKAF